MKILHIITSLKVGGAESFLYQLLQQLINRQVNEHIVAFFHQGPYRDKLHDLGVKTYQISGLWYRYDPYAYYQLISIIRHEKPDIIQTSLWAATIFGRLAGQQLSIPVICEVHGNCSIVASPFKNWLDRITINMPRMIVAVSHQVGEAYKKTIIRNKKTNLIVINNGVDKEQLQALSKTHPVTRAALGLTTSDFVIGSVGRLEAIKSYDILIRAVALMLKKQFNAKKAIKLCLVGDGSQRAYLENLAKQLDIRSSVIFVGERIDAYRFYRLFNCFALSSQTEGLSIALLEALAFGLPVITTHQTTTHEVIQNNLNGFLVPVNDYETFAAALEKIYHNQELAHAMTSANRHISEQYDLQHTVNAYLKLYTSLAPSKNIR